MYVCMYNTRMHIQTYKRVRREKDKRASKEMAGGAGDDGGARVDRQQPCGPGPCLAACALFLGLWTNRVAPWRRKSIARGGHTA